MRKSNPITKNVGLSTSWSTEDESMATIKLYDLILFVIKNFICHIV